MGWECLYGKKIDDWEGREMDLVQSRGKETTQCFLSSGEMFKYLEASFVQYL